MLLFFDDDVTPPQLYTYKGLSEPNASDTTPNLGVPHVCPLCYSRPGSACNQKTKPIVRRTEERGRQAAIALGPMVMNHIADIDFEEVPNCPLVGSARQSRPASAVVPTDGVNAVSQDLS